MAFNPFHAFRKRQKTLLAALAIFCMFMFVLSTGLGKGDFFGLMDKTGTGRSKSEPAGKLYGKTITATDINEIEQQRRIAEIYIRTAMNLGQQEVMRKATGELTSQLKSDENALNVIKQATSIHQFLAFFARQQGVNMGQLMAMLQQSVMQLQNLQFSFMTAKREEDAILVRKLAEVLLQDQRLLTQPPGQLYFGGSVRNVRDLFQFKIWLHQADRLGIQLSNADIGKMIKQEALDQLTAQSFFDLDQMFFGQYKNIDHEYLSQALGNEFRVRLAKAAFLGYNQRPDSEESFVVPPAVTPYESWQFFRTQRTESEIALLPISVKSKDFLAEAGKPTDDELKKLYEQYKLFEPVPSLPTFGFKQPERIEVEWVNARADSPWYQEQAKHLHQVVQHTLQSTSGTALPLGGMPAQLGAAVPWAFNLPLIGQYESIYIKTRYPAASWFEPFRNQLHEHNLVRVENAVSMLGHALAGSATGTPSIGASLAYLGTGSFFETREGLRLLNELVLNSAHPLPWLAGGTYYAVTPKEAFQPLAAIRHRVEESLVNDLARDLVRANLSKVIDELYRLSFGNADHLVKLEEGTQPRLLASLIGQMLGDTVNGAPLAAPVAYGSQLTSGALKDASQRAGRSILLGAAGNPWSAAAVFYQEQALPEQRARAYLAKAIPEYHLQHGTTSTPRSRLNIADDPGLEPLKRSFSSLPATESHERNFDQLFFPDFFGAYMPKRWPRTASQQGLVDPTQFDPTWNAAADPFVYWKSGIFPAYVPSFEEAKPQVEEAWRIEKARKFAQAEADRLAAEARKAGADALKVLKDGSKHSGSLMNLDHVARLERPIFAFQSREMDANTYRPYRVPSIKVEYPSTDFLDKLLDLKEKGQVAVLSDRPETTYYVAALVNRVEPDEAGFYQDYSRHSSALLALIEQDKHYREHSREAIMKRLDQEAGLEISPEFEKRFTNPRGSDTDE
jgi:hypothetical protein